VRENQADDARPDVVAHEIEAGPAVGRAIEPVTGDRGIENARIGRIDRERMNIEGRESLRHDATPCLSAVVAKREDVMAGGPNR
jgi:hypothetical protein